MRRFISKKYSFTFIGYINGLVFIRKDNKIVDYFRSNSAIKNYNDFHKEVEKYMLTTENR